MPQVPGMSVLCWTLTEWPSSSSAVAQSQHRVVKSTKISKSMERRLRCSKKQKLIKTVKLLLLMMPTFLRKALQLSKSRLPTSYPENDSTVKQDLLDVTAQSVTDCQSVASSSCPDLDATLC